LHVLQVDRERHEARRRYREDERSQVNQAAWRAQVIALKQAQSELRASREAYFKWVSEYSWVVPAESSCRRPAAAFCTTSAGTAQDCVPNQTLKCDAGHQQQWTS
jgi:hypothetical protein